MTQAAAPAIDMNDQDRATVLELLGRYLPDVTVWAYGSRVRWNARPQSDLDLVVFAPPEQRGAVSQLREAFEESSLPFSVDLLVWDDLPESFHRNIQTEYVVLQVNELMSAGTVYGTFSSRFTRSNLGNLCEKESGIQTGPFGSQLHKKDYVPEGTPIITVEHLGDNRISHQDLPRVSDYDKARLSKYVLQTGDVVFSRVGSVDRRSLVRESEDGWLFSGRCLCVRPDPEKIDAGYLSYFLGLPAFREYIRSIAVGATMPSLNTSLLSDVAIYYPPLPEQRAIAHILGALDDKIDLNRRINQTLEQMAQAIFQDWFVDFGPVRAKLEGREPYLPPELWDLFPHRLADSELGQIPEGWEFGCLGDVADFPMRSVSPADLAEETPYIGLEHMPRRSITLAEWGRANKVTSNKLAFQKGEFLFGKLRPYFHKVGVAPTDGICSTDIVVVAPNANLWSCLVLSYISTDEFVAYTDQTSTGTRMPRTNWKAMSQYEIRLPPEPVARAFQKITQHLLDRIAVNIHESRALAAQRDALLPKLVSGELRPVEAGVSENGNMHRVING